MTRPGPRHWGLFLVEIFDLFAQRFHDGARFGRDAVRMILAQVFVARERLAGESVQEGFAEQLAVGRMTQVNTFNTLSGIETVIFLTCSLFLPCSA